MGIIRFLLAAAVVLGHSGPILGTSLVPGPAAVQAFFAISGFYMAMVLNQKYAADLRGYGTFIGNRVLRLYPSYLLALVISIVMYATLSERAATPTPWSRWAGLDVTWQAAVGLVNLFVIGQDALLFMAVDRAAGELYFAGAFTNQPEGALHFLLVPQAWTLSLEFCFYLIAPFIVRRSVWTIGSLIAASLALRFSLAVGLNWREDPFYNRFFPNELALFLLGSLMYHVYRAMTARNVRLHKAGWSAIVVVIVAMLVLTRLPIPFKSLSFAALVGVLTPFIFAATKSVRWDRLIGELSYPLYICHHIVGYVLGAYGSHGNGAANLVLSTLLAILVYTGLERPIETIRQRISARELSRRTVSATNAADVTKAPVVTPPAMQ